MNIRIVTVIVIENLDTFLFNIHNKLPISQPIHPHNVNGFLYRSNHSADNRPPTILASNLEILACLPRERFSLDNKFISRKELIEFIHKIGCLTLTFHKLKHEATA